MPTAPTLVAASIVINPINGTTPSLGPFQVGDVVTVLAAGEGTINGANFNAPTTTLSNSGISQLQLHPTNNDCQAGAWTFTVASGTTTGTISVAMGSGSDNIVLFVAVERGGVQPTAVRSALGTGSGRTVSYTPSQADSALIWIVADWSAPVAVAPTPTPTTHTSGSPGPSALPGATQFSPHFTHYEDLLDDQTGTGAVGYGIGGSGTGPFTIIVVEVQGTGGTPPVADEGSSNKHAALEIFQYAGIDIYDGSY